MTYAVCQYFPLMFLKNTVQTLRRGLMFIILRLIYKTIGAYYIFFRWKYTSKLDAQYICVKRLGLSSEMRITFDSVNEVQEFPMKPLGNVMR